MRTYHVGCSRNATRRLLSSAKKIKINDSKDSFFWIVVEFNESHEVKKRKVRRITTWITEKWWTGFIGCKTRLNILERFLLRTSIQTFHFNKVRFYCLIWNNNTITKSHWNDNWYRPWNKKIVFDHINTTNKNITYYPRQCLEDIESTWNSESNLQQIKKRKKRENSCKGDWLESRDRRLHRH
jgi:hypothetical protein